MDAVTRLNPKKLLAGVLLFVLFIMSVSYVTGVRKFGADYRFGSSFDLLQEFLVSVTVNTNFGGYLPTAISTAALGTEAPTLYGRTLLISPLVQFIPRAYFPGKPEELGGEVRKVLQEVGFFRHGCKGGCLLAFMQKDG